MRIFKIRVRGFCVCKCLIRGRSASANNSRWGVGPFQRSSADSIYDLTLQTTDDFLTASSTDVAVVHGRASTLGHAMGGCDGHRRGRGKDTRGVAPGPTTERVAEVEIVSQSPVQALKNHLQLIRRSTILDNIGTRILGGRLMRGSDLYVSIYGTCRRLIYYGLYEQQCCLDIILNDIYLHFILHVY